MKSFYAQVIDPFGAQWVIDGHWAGVNRRYLLPEMAHELERSWDQGLLAALMAAKPGDEDEHGRLYWIRE